MMALESDGSSITTVVTCKGDLLDPAFPKQLECVLGSLEDLLGGHLYVCKLEPWNSVRVTLSIPREAALRLRQLAREGSQQLQALGILSVQVEGDQVISLRLAGPERQEIVLQTVQQDEGASSSSANPDGGLSRLLSGDAQVPTNSVSSEKMQFRSPNVVCPPDSVVPKVPTPGAVSSTLSTSRVQSGPFPFTSMNQALQSRENSSGTSTAFTPPPPYPGKHPPVTLSSPLLVNLLQNDGAASKVAKMEIDNGSATKIQANGSMVHPGTSKSMPSNSAAFSPKMSTSKVPSPLPSKAPAVPARTAVYSLTQSTPVTPTVQNSHPKMVHSQSTVTVNSSLSSDPSFKQLSSPVTAASAAAATVANMQRGNPNNTSPSLLNSKATLLPNSAVRQTNVLPVPSSTITKPSAVLQNSGELELSSQSVVASKLNIAPQSSNNATMQSSAVIPNSNKSNPLLQSRVPPPPPPPPPLPQPPPSPSASISSIEDSQNVPNCVKNSFRPSSPLSSLPNLMELTPTLTDLKESDLDQLLPSLERDIASSPPELPEVLTDTKDHRKFLINPLTGELELQSSSDSESEEPKNVFTGLPSPVATSDDDTGPANRFDTTDHSDSETVRSVSSDSKNSKLKSTKSRDRGRDSPSLKPTEKIKLRLKLEKSEPVSSGYKVDVSFINTQQPKKATSTNVMTGGEELRVPPLHISLRGRNHVVINNKKKVKVNADGSISKPKVRKMQGDIKPKKVGESNIETDGSLSPLNKPSADFVNNSLPLEHTKSSALDSKKVKRIKSVQEHREQNLLAGGHIVDRSKDYESAYSSHFKEKLKERRGSDSELAHSAKRFPDNNGLISADKKRRLSQTDHFDESQPSVLGSTNTGTIPALSPKPKKGKLKVKENSKGKEIDRSKSYAKNLADKLAKQVALPTGEIDMEAKFKQRLLENSDKIHINRSYRTENVQKVEGSNLESTSEKVAEHAPSLTNPIPHKDKPPEIEKCNDQKSDLTEKQVVGRSPNSGGQGEDSGIESMDALSEKSPNQAGQSPHGDISDSLKSKTQVPDILDIEAQLAKMEGLNGEDLNENKQNSNTKLEQCCGLAASERREQDKDKSSVDISRSAVGSKEEDLEPLPVRVTPPLYTYSNPEKIRSSESPSLSDSDSNSCSVGSILKSKSLLEQLLIEIPDNQAPSSPSPVTRSLRTRACSKLNSPELSSPVPQQQQQQQQQHKHAKGTNTPGMTKRKRHESESSNNSLDDARNKKPRKCSENAAELIKACMGVETTAAMGKTTPTNMGSNVIREKKNSRILEESSDSDEPLIEVAGKVRKNNNVGLNTPKAKMKSTSLTPINKAGSINTRRSVRTTPALNTRSKGDKANPDAEVLRRKTRSSVSEGEGKRRKDVK